MYMGGKEVAEFIMENLLFMVKVMQRNYVSNEARLKTSITFIHLDIVIEYTLYVPKSNGKHEIQNLIHT